METMFQPQRSLTSVLRNKLRPVALSCQFLFSEQKKNKTPKDVPFRLFRACRQLSVLADLRMVKGRVVVVARGICEFAEKVELMQKAGAVGVIVVNFNEEGELLANMKLRNEKESSEIHIPIAMISYKDWATILPCRNDSRVIFTTEEETTFDMDYGRDAFIWTMMRGIALWILTQQLVSFIRKGRAFFVNELQNQ